MREMAAQLADLLAALLAKRLQRSQHPKAQGANSDRFANAHSRSSAKLRKRCRCLHVTRGYQPYRFWAVCIISLSGPSKRLKALRSNANKRTVSLAA